MGKVNFSLILKLAIASLVVGALMALAKIDPIHIWKDLWYSVVDFVEFIFGRGFEGIMAALRYTFYGAMIVLPIWLVTTLLSKSKGQTPPAPKE